MRKNVVEITEKQLEKAADFQEFMEMDKERMFKEMGNQMKVSEEQRDQLQVSPAKAFASAQINNLSEIAIFLTQYESMVQLSQGKSAFNDAFLWIPSLSGPNGIGTYGFEAILNLPGSAPFLIAPLLVFASMLLGQQLEPAKLNQMPSISPTQNGKAPLNFFTPAILAIAALYNPAAVSLSWLTSTVLSNVQKVGAKAVLKLEGLDIEEIEERNVKVRNRMEELMKKNMEDMKEKGMASPFPFGMGNMQQMNISYDAQTG